jgi:hypothetical protein
MPAIVAAMVATFRMVVDPAVDATDGAAERARGEQEEEHLDDDVEAAPVT